VPNKPLFSNTGKTYHPPGSHAWYQHIYRAYFADKDRKRLNALEKIEREKLEMARYHGTSMRKYKQKTEEVSWLTNFQDKYHRLAVDTAPKNNFNKARKRWYSNNFKDYVPPFGKRPVKSDTSEETRKIEERVNKRQVQNVDLVSHKKVRLITDCPDDQSIEDIDMKF
jgi:hypothetical protein